MTGSLPPAVDGPPPALIDAAYTHLRQLDVIGAADRPRWRLLGGGVSNWVLLFDCGDGVVVKAALARLRVADEWLADPSRAVAEGRAMRVLGARLPGGDLPRVLFVDDTHYLLGMTCAPHDAHTWKEDLLQGRVDLPVAEQVGALLGRMHRAAWQDPDLARQFDDLSLFRQLRLDPYHERAAQVAERRGEHDIAALLRAGAEEMGEHRMTLVHGDFSPKNLLVHRGGTLALDFEVVHWGNPDFDTAFLLTHLTLKALHRPEVTAQLREAADVFFVHYAHALGRREEAAIRRGALRQAGSLLMARADGKSPAEYLDNGGRTRARLVGARVLREEITEIDGLFESEGGR